MNIEELFRTHFGPEGAKLLGDAIDLNEERAVPLVDRVVRWQFETLAQHAKSETGRANIIDAIGRMPPFATVEQGLTEQGGFNSLLRAGQYLAPLVLGDDQQDISGQIARVEGVAQPIVHNMMTITLPLLISFAGQKGLSAQNITSIMSTVRASGLRPRPAGGSYVSRAAALQGDAAKKAGEVELPLTEGAQPREVVNKPSFVADEEFKAMAAPAEVEPLSEVPAAPVRPVSTAPDSVLPKAPALAPAAPRSYQKEDLVADLFASGAKKTAQPSEAVLSSAAAAGAAAAAVAASEMEDADATELHKVDAPEVHKVETPEVRKVESAELHKVEAAEVIKLEATELTKVEGPELAKVEPPEVYKQESTELFKTEAAPKETAPSAAPEVAPEPAEPASKPVSTAASLAEAAAAAGVGAGAVASAAARAEKRASTGSAWKSAPVRVSGTEPSRAKPAAQTATTTVTTVSAAKPAIETTTSTDATVAYKTALAAPVAAVAALATGGLLDPNRDVHTPDDLIRYIRGLFSVPEASKIAESVGFSAPVAAEAVQGGVPVLLRALAQKGETAEGAAEIASLAEGFSGVLKDGQLSQSMLGSSAELGALEVQAMTVVPKFLNNRENVSARLASAIGGSGAQMGRLLMVSAPVVLGALAPVAKSLGAEKFSALLRDLGPERLRGLLSPETAAVGALLSSKLHGIEVKEKENATLLETKKAKAAGATPPSAPVGRATVPPVAPPPQPVTPPPAPKGGFPWWLVAALVLGLGGCYIANQSKAPAPAVPATTAPANTTSAATTEAPVYRVEGDGKREWPLEPLAVAGVAAPNEVISIVNAAGEELASATADAAGKWSTQLPAPVLGSNIYKVRDASGKIHEPPILEVTGVAAADDSNKGVYSIAQPTSAEPYTDTGFALSGTAEPNGSYQLLENGVSVGKFTADASGNWSVNVPPAQAGEYTYSVVKEDGSEVISLPLQVVASAPAESCSAEYSLSLADGQNIDAPFRFGGVGNGSGYRVRVLRDGKQIGSKDIALQPNCTWNYLSQPGGTAGEVADITYEVSSLDAPDTALSTIKLSVQQAGQR